MGFEIVKPAVDVGVQTNDWPANESFWGEVVGLRYDHLLKVGGGIHQHRFDLHGAVLKCNSHRDPLADDAPTGFAGLVTVGRDPGQRTSPDGVPVEVVGALPGDVRTAVRVEASDRVRTLAALVDGLGATASADPGRVRIGETALDVVEVPDRAPTRGRDGRGIRYLTVQVREVRGAHAHALDHGLTEGTAPIRLGDVAFISFVRLPDGDWVELSQRASLTGALPDDAPRSR